MTWYLSVLVPIAVVNLRGLPCPLTVWEKHFWRLAGETPYRGGFISQYFVEPFYAPGLRPGDETALLVVVVVWCLLWLLYAAVSRLRLRSGSIPQSHARPTLDTNSESLQAHCPSGHFAANAAWLTCATVAHNLYRWLHDHTSGRRCDPSTPRTQQPLLTPTTGPHPPTRR